MIQFRYAAVQDADLSINKFQQQIDVLTGKNIKYLNQLAESKGKLIETKHQLLGGIQSEVIGHFKAKYEAITDCLDHKDVFKLFITSEQQNLETAIEACISGAPDAVLFFQPFLTCSFENTEIRINAKRVIIIESNCFLTRHYKELIESLPETRIHAVTLNHAAMSRMKFYCRTTFGSQKFPEEFFKLYQDKICLPTLKDGFTTVTSISAEKLLKLVK